MKIVILAAGKGSRLGSITKKIPKTLVTICEKPIIDYQLEVLDAAGIEEKDIIVLCGYKEKVLRERYKERDIQFISNVEYENTNMVYTLMCIKDLLKREDEVIVCYGDIIYDISVFEKVYEACDPISVVVDTGWKAYWEERFSNPLEDAESLRIDGKDNIISIGQKVETIEEIQAQFIGLIKLKGDGLKQICEYYERIKKKENVCTGSFRNMYMTDFLQGLVNDNIKIRAIKIKRKWYEVDSAEDIVIAERAKAELRSFVD